MAFGEVEASTSLPCKNRHTCFISDLRIRKLLSRRLVDLLCSNVTSVEYASNGDRKLATRKKK